MSGFDDLPRVDSKEGMEILIQHARTNGLILDQWHKRLAEKHGVETAGVSFVPPLIPCGSLGLYKKWSP